MLTGAITYVGPNGVYRPPAKLRGYRPPSVLRGLGQTDSSGTMLDTTTAPPDQPGAFSNVGSAFSVFFGSLGPVEWLVLIGGVVLLGSVLFTGASAVSGVRSYRKRRASAARRKEELQQELARL